MTKSTNKIQLNCRMFFFIILRENSPYLKIRNETIKNLSPLDKIDSKIKSKMFIPKIPDAKHVIL